MCLNDCSVIAVAVVSFGSHRGSLCGWEVDGKKKSVPIPPCSYGVCVLMLTTPTPAFLVFECPCPLRCFPVDPNCRLGMP